VNDPQPSTAPDVTDARRRLQVDDLLAELELRLASVRMTRDRVRELLAAVVTIGSGLDLDRVLHTIIDTAASLVGARYGALGVLGPDGRLTRFVTVGLSEDRLSAIGNVPTDERLLKELIHPADSANSAPSANPATSLNAATRANAGPEAEANRDPQQLLVVPIRVRQRVYGHLYLSEKRAGAAFNDRLLFDDDDEAVLTALATAAGIAIDNARRYTDTRRRQRRLAATAELTRALLSGADYREVLGLLAERAARLADADLVFIATPSRGTGTRDADLGHSNQRGSDQRDSDAHDIDALGVPVAHGLGSDLMRRQVVPLADTATGTVFRTGTHVVLADATRASFRPTLDACGLGPGPVLATPIGAAGHTRGVLVLVRAAGSADFDGAVTRIVTDLAAQAAVVLEMADRRADAERLSVYAERDRIGRDLHDLAIQRLFAIGMSLRGATRRGDRADMTPRVERAIDDLDETIDVIRSTILELNSRDIEPCDGPHRDGPHRDDRSRESLRARVLRVCEQAAATLPHTPATRFTGPVDTAIRDEVMRENLLAVLREALSNAARHAGARRVDVEVRALDGELSLRVTDDGHGFAHAVDARGGLTTMAERAKLLGGAFHLSPGEHGGTVVRWEVPLPELPTPTSITSTSDTETSGISSTPSGAP
jgi:signal transduction histidine kinase